MSTHASLTSGHCVMMLKCNNSQPMLLCKAAGMNSAHSIEVGLNLADGKTKPIVFFWTLKFNFVWHDLLVFLFAELFINGN